MPLLKEIHVDVPVPTTSLSSYFFGCHLLIYLCNTKCLEPVQDKWIPEALFSYFSKKLFAVGAHWKRLFLMCSWAKSVVFSLSFDLHVLPYFVDYSRTGTGCTLEQAHLSQCCWQMQ